MLPMPQVLVLRALGLGDLLTGVPALRGIRRAFPDSEITLATSPIYGELAALTDAVDTVLPTSGLSPLRWPGRPPAVAVNLHGSGPQSHRVLQEVRPDRLIAFDSRAAGVSGPDWRPEEYEVQRWCRLLESAGIECDATDLLLRRPSSSGLAWCRGAVVIHPGAAYPSRRWPAARFAEVADALHRRGRRVAVTGAASEAELARQVSRDAGLPDEAVLAGRTTLVELAVVVADSAVVVSGDTGIAHLATAYGTPSVVLFGPVPPAWWGPPPDRPQHIALWHGTSLGDPFGGAPDPALLHITVDEVLAAVDRAVAAGPSPTEGHPVRF
jgi:ADP-heptose:LPS heptosyltransferase